MHQLKHRIPSGLIGNFPIGGIGRWGDLQKWRFQQLSDQRPSVLSVDLGWQDFHSIVESFLRLLRNCPARNQLGAPGFFPPG
jgi:hypothetical protein